MSSRIAIALLPMLLAAGVTAATGQGPASTELPGKIFAIQKTWTIGGEGDWDYLTLDPQAVQLFVAHGPAVEVVDVGAGTVSGRITGLRDAHGIALDDQGQFGYISDGAASDVKIFSRSSLKVEATVGVCKSPRSVVFEPASRLVFAICPSEAQEARIPQSRNGQRSSDSEVQSEISVIDADTHKRLADLMISGKLGFAQADGRGSVFVNVQDRNQIATFDAQDFADKLRRLAAGHEDEKTDKNGKPAGGNPTLTLDWGAFDARQAIPSPVHIFRLGMACMSPRGLAVDGQGLRLFAACDNAKMEVLNAGTGAAIATLTTGPGTDAIAYDANRGLIFVANGGGLGSLTVIRQNVTDSYSVIQQLPTRQRARTLAVNPSNGEVYLVTNLEGFDRNQKGVGAGTHTLPVVQATPVAGSFQVLVVGN